MSQYQDRRQEDMDSEKIDIVQYIVRFWAGFRHIWWIILPFMAAMAIINCLKAEPNESSYYHAMGTYTIAADIGYSSSYTNRSTAQQMATTFQSIMSANMLTKTIAEDLGVEEGEVSAYSIYADVIEGTNLLTIHVTGDDGAMAQNILTSLTNNYQDVAEYIIGRTKMTVVEEAVAQNISTYKPDYGREVKNGVKSGLVYGLVIAVIYMLLRKTILSGKDITNRLNQHVLGILPMAAFKAGSRKKAKAILINNNRLSANYRDCISAMRVRLLHRLQSLDTKTFMVTSTLPSEGKTTVAVNLAMSLAQLGKRVILVDCDFRLANVAKTMQLDRNHPGVLEVLNKKAELDEALIQMEDMPLSVLICSGATSKAPEYAGSKKMQNLLEELKELADYVILDTPPTSGMADAMEFTNYVDGIVYVVRYDHAHEMMIYHAIEGLSGGYAKMLGCVLNMADKYAMAGSNSGYSYREYGSYGGYRGYKSYGYGNKERE